MSNKVRQLMQRLAERKPHGIFYPAYFTDIGDRFFLYVTCPSCGTITYHEVLWKNIDVSTWKLSASFEIACPSCATVVAAYMSGRPGGRGEMQYNIVEAMWNNTMHTNYLKAKPPIHLYPDAPLDIPPLGKQPYFSEPLYGGSWWEARVPEGWTMKSNCVFLPPYESKLFESGFWLNMHRNVGISGYGHYEVPPEIHNPEERKAFLMTRVAVDMAYGINEPIKRYQFGSVVGYFGMNDKDGITTGIGNFFYQDWNILARLSTPTKNFAYIWGCAQHIMGSLKFHDKKN